MDPSGQRHVPQGTSPKSKLDMVACDEVWRHDSMKRGTGKGRVQNDELCKPGSSTESKVQISWEGTRALRKSPSQAQGHVKRSKAKVVAPSWSWKVRTKSG